jgi:DNA-binding CsgD family transcriptional regulator
VGAIAAERVRDRLRSLSTAGLDPETFSRSALELLRPAVPFEAACSATLDPATHLITDTVKVAIGDEHDQQWAQLEYEVDDYAKFIELARRPVRVTTVELETDGDPSRSCRLQELLRPAFGIGHELRAATGVDGAVWGGICLFREEGAPGFSAAETDFVASVTDSYAVGLRMGLLAEAAAGVPGVAAGPAVLVVGADDELVQISVGAQTRLTELAGAPTDAWSRLPMALLSLVGAARSFADGRFPNPPQLRLRAPSGQWWVAHASVLAARDGGRSSVVITIEEARPPEIVPLVVAAFGLTARERDVVQLVLQGADTGEIARTLHVSPYTVQDHLKSVFAKAGVRSRRELTARVFFDQYAGRLGGPLSPSGWFADTPSTSRQ